MFGPGGSAGRVARFLIVICLVFAGLATGSSPSVGALVVAGPETTGVPAGTSLTPSGYIRVTVDGTVIDGLDVTGQIVVEANDVVIRNTRIRTNGAIHGIRNTGKRLLVEDVEVDGDSECSSGIVYGGYTVRRVNVHGCLDGIRAGSDSVIEDSWVHDLFKIPGVSHTDAIQSEGGSRVRIARNRLDGPYLGATSAINLIANAAPVNDVVIEHNVVSGGSYTLYLRRKTDANGNYKQPAPTNIVVRDNVWTRNTAIYGAHSVDPTVQISEWARNTWTDGAVVGQPVYAAPVTGHVAVSDASVWEGNEGTRVAYFVISLRAPLPNASSVTFTIVPGSATAGSDIKTRSAKLTFTAGQRAKRIGVTVLADTTSETNEQFTVQLSSPTNLTVTRGIGTGTIANDDAWSGLRAGLGDVTITEGNEGTRAGNVTLTLNRASNSSVVVDYAVSAGSATAATDFKTASGRVTFLAGQMSKVLKVTAFGETKVEGDETVSVRIVSVAGAVVGDGTSTVTITNDD